MYSLLEAFGGFLVFLSLSLIPWGCFGLGKIDAKSAAAISFICGVMSFIWALAFIYPLSLATAVVAANFSFAFISAGIHFYRGVDPRGHGVLCWTLAGIVAILGAFISSASMPFLTFSVWTYFVVLVLFGGGSYFGSPKWIKAFAYFSIFVGVVTTGAFGMLWSLGRLHA